MAQQAAESEPTMEEILASIRRIINEDDEKPAGQDETAPAAAAEPAPEPAPEPEPEAAVAAEPAPEPEPEESVLELTEAVEEPAAGSSPLAVEDDLMFVDREEPQPAPAPEPEPAAAAPEPALAPAPEPAPEEDALLDQTAATAAAGAFGALAANLRVASTDGQTLEALVRELMKPMLKQWLDANLPRIVEEKVEAEIERVARRR